MAQTGFYAGSFDPVTNGHIDIIKRSIGFVDHLVIGIGVHHGKKALFKDDQRLEMLNKTIEDMDIPSGKSIDVVTFDDLVVSAAKRAGANIIIRGLRDTTDFDYEAQMAGMNKGVEPEVDTVFLVSSHNVRHIAAKFVRQIASMGGNISSFVPTHVETLLKQKFNIK